MIITDTNITYGFGTTKWGDGRKKETVDRVRESEHLSHIPVLIPHQAHTTTVQILRSISDFDPHKPTDGLVTSCPQIILGVLTADCVPIVYYDRKHKVIGVSHQGWKGTLGAMPAVMVQSMQALGAETDEIVCVIGPSIRACCYPIYAQRAVHFEAVFGQRVFVKKKQGDFLNLAEANAITLRNASISENNISVIEKCTCHTPERYFSFFRDGVIKGEMLNIICRGV